MVNLKFLERIHGAGHSVKMDFTHPVEPPPAEIDLSGLNARDRRRIREADKKVKDHTSLIGRSKRNASSIGDDNDYRKTLLVDDGSLEGSKSMAATANNALSSIPATDAIVAITNEKGGPTDDSSLSRKRKVEGSDPLIQGRSKTTRKEKTTPLSSSVPILSEVRDKNPDSGIVLREPLGSGMPTPWRPRGNTSRTQSSSSSGSGLVARASSPSGNFHQFVINGTFLF